jgi:acyl-CoA oxidase
MENNFKRIYLIKDQLKSNLLSKCGKDKPTGPNVPDYLKVSPGDKESLTCGGTSHILPEERKNGTFKTEELYEFLCGGKEMMKRRKFIETAITKDYHEMHDVYNNERDEHLANGVGNFVKIHKTWKNYKPTRYDIGIMAEISIGYGSLNNSHGIFLQTIAGQGDHNQQRFWIPKILNFELTGAYAQTELGHGSNVRGLSTIAVFDKKTDEFVIDTPTLRSIKWWPGALGKASTHCTLYAQLIIDGKEHGLCVFIVQIRDENFLPLPGVRCGDLGMKVGDNANDTGFLILENIRVPRENLLCKYKTVSREGEFKVVANTDPKVHYTTMIQTRAMMVNTSAGRLAQASTIAVRYSCVRTQGFKNTKPGVSYLTEEKKIIDHQIQRYRVLKQLATAYALKFNARWMVEQQSLIEGGEVGVIKNTDLLKELAASSAGLKSLTSQIAIHGAEDLRKTCGGNGYLLNSGIAALVSDYAWQVTAEGDMIILALSTARHITSTINKAFKGKKVSGIFDYLNAIDSENFCTEKLRPKKLSCYTDLNDLQYLLDVFRFRSLEKNLAITKELNRLQSVEKLSNEDAWNKCSLELLAATYAHCYYVIVLNFISKINEMKTPNIKDILIKLFVLFATSYINENNWSDIYNKEEMRHINTAIEIVLGEIRPQAVTLVDSFGVPDGVLKSTIGRYDGNVYEALFDAAQKSTLNQSDPFLGYKYLKPHLNTNLLKHGNKSTSGVKF